MYRIDERDLAIIEAKQREPETTLSKIAERMGCPFSTVQARHQRLVDRGVIRYRVEIDHERLSAAQAA